MLHVCFQDLQVSILNEVRIPRTEHGAWLTQSCLVVLFMWHSKMIELHKILLTFVILSWTFTWVNIKIVVHHVIIICWKTKFIAFQLHVQQNPMFILNSMWIEDLYIQTNYKTCMEEPLVSCMYLDHHLASQKAFTCIILSIVV